MINIKKILVLLILLIAVTNSVGKKLNIVASIPDIGDMVSIIGKERVKVKTLATGKEDLHAVPVRPSFLPLLNRADLLITLGLDAEHAWLPTLAAEARNPKVMEGGKGWIELYDGIKVLDKPEVLDRSEGEQHPDGNPHFNIGPQTGVTMALNIKEVLIKNDPEGKDYYNKNFENYKSQIETLVKELKVKGTKLKGKKIICYHPDVSYLAEFYEMEIIGSIEPKAGVAPTALHLKKLEEKGSRESVELIIYNQSQPGKLPLKLASSLNAKDVKIANAVNALKGTEAWLSLQKYNCQVLLKALGE